MKERHNDSRKVIGDNGLEQRQIILLEELRQVGVTHRTDEPQRLPLRPEFWTFV